MVGVSLGCSIQFDPDLAFACDNDLPCAEGYVCCGQPDGSNICEPAELCPHCGDGSCGDDETATSCPVDCGGICQNDVCEPEAGENPETCPWDCSTCGDGTCVVEAGENCFTCGEDCGSCGCNMDGVCDRLMALETCDGCADCQPCCGDGVCDHNREEDCNLCPEDCSACTGNFCGDGVCSSPEEDPASCAIDCPL